MSILAEIAAMAGGMIAEYATQKKWGTYKTFLFTAIFFFFLFASLVTIFPSERGLGVGIGLAAAVGVIFGLIVVGLMHIAKKSNEGSNRI